MSGRPRGVRVKNAAHIATSEHRVFVDHTIGEVSALLVRPADAACLYVLAHGAGAGMQHSFMQALAQALAKRKVATFRYQFPFVEAGRRRPDHKSRLLPTVRAAIAAGHQAASGLPLFAGGKSMGGRMTSQAIADSNIATVRGLVFVGFPLHPAKKPGNGRADHLADVETPMLFLQGTRDTLADLSVLRPVCKKLGARATLHILDGADHGFSVLKRSGRTDADVLDELVDVAATWMLARCGS